MVDVRLATLKDKDAVFDIAGQFASSFALDRGAFDPSFLSLLESLDARLLVAQESPGVVGYLLGFDHLTFFANGLVSWVEEIAVEPRWRRQGIGSCLMEQFEEWSRSRGSKLCALAPRRAAPFYTALGYEKSATYFRRLL